MKSSNNIRVATWNVLWRFGDAWRERQVAIAATLAAHQPDIVGLQESWAGRDASQAELLATPLGMHSVFAGPSLPSLPAVPDSPDHAGIDLGVSVLSRWPIRHSWVHTMPSSRSVPPVALVAALDHPRGLLHVVCTCAEHHAHLADDHLAQTQDLAQLVEELSQRDGELPVFLIGDLNAGPVGPEIRALTDSAIDAWVAGGRGDGADSVTLSSANPLAPLEATKQIDRRIDYVMFRPSATGMAPEVSQVYVVDDTVEGLPASDHYAVVADLSL